MSAVWTAGVCGAPAPAAVLREWLLWPFLHLHQLILGYNFSNGRYQTQWRQRPEPRVWRLYSSLVSCHQATGQRILREQKKTISVCLIDLFTGNTNDPLYSCLYLSLWGLLTCLEPFCCCCWSNWNSPVFSFKLGLWAKANFLFDSASVSLQEIKLNGGYKQVLTKLFYLWTLFSFRSYSLYYEMSPKVSLKFNGCHISRHMWCSGIVRSFKAGYQILGFVMQKVL